MPMYWRNQRITSGQAAKWPHSKAAKFCAKKIPFPLKISRGNCSLVSRASPVEIEYPMAFFRTRWLTEIAILVVVVGFFPGVAGYGWAIGWLPIYGAVCHFDKVFGSVINPDGFRIYLADRGCDVDAAIRDILATSQFAAGQDKVDADKMVDIYHHKQLAVAASEFLARDLVLQKLREFATSSMGANACTPDDRYCATPEALDGNFFSRWIRSYIYYVQSQFQYTVMDGADYIASLLRMGPLAQAVIALCYLIGSLLATRGIIRYIILRSLVPRKIAKNE
jgi:hypothetical protein